MLISSAYLAAAAAALAGTAACVPAKARAAAGAPPALQARAYLGLLPEKPVASKGKVVAWAHEKMPGQRPATAGLDRGPALLGGGSKSEAPLQTDPLGAGLLRGDEPSKGDTAMVFMGDDDKGQPRVVVAAGRDPAKAWEKLQAGVMQAGGLFEGEAMTAGRALLHIVAVEGGGRNSFPGKREIDKFTGKDIMAWRDYIWRHT